MISREGRMKNFKLSKVAVLIAALFLIGACAKTNAVGNTKTRMAKAGFIRCILPYTHATE